MKKLIIIFIGFFFFCCEESGNEVLDENQVKDIDGNIYNSSQAQGFQP